MSNYQPITLSKDKFRIKKKIRVKKNCRISRWKNYINKARAILAAAGDDLQKQTEAISQIVGQTDWIRQHFKMMRYVDQLAKEFKIKKGDFTIAIKEDSSHK